MPMIFDAGVRTECTLTFYCFAGMSMPEVDRWHRDHTDEAACRRKTAKILRRRRALGYIVQTLERGKRWEVTAPDDAGMVSDNEGTLTLTVDVVEADEEPSDDSWWAEEPEDPPETF